MIIKTMFILMLFLNGNVMNTWDTMRMSKVNG